MEQVGCVSCLGVEAVVGNLGSLVDTFPQPGEKPVEHLESKTPMVEPLDWLRVNTAQRLESQENSPNVRCYSLVLKYWKRQMVAQELVNALRVEVVEPNLNTGYPIFAAAVPRTLASASQGSTHTRTLAW